LGIGSEEASVRVIKRGPDEAERASVIVAKEMLERILQLLGVSASVVVQESPLLPQSGGRSPIALEVTGHDLGVLIGRRGQTLASLQYLVYLMVSHLMKARVPLSIDVEGYRERRQEALKNLALRMAERVRSTRQSVTLEPMPARERRIIHLTLQDYPQVITESIGEGEGRKVTILYKEQQA